MPEEIPEHVECRRSIQLELYHSKRESYIKEMGGKCNKCGSTNNLEFDHIDRFDKDFNISIKWTANKTKMKKELAKCQLLCQQCHAEKTILERGLTPAKGTHGTLSSYRYCKCDECKTANNKYNYERKHKNTSYENRPIRTDRDNKGRYIKGERKRDQSIVNKVIELRNSGLSYYKISDIVGLHRNTISKIISEYTKS